MALRRGGNGPLLRSNRKIGTLTIQNILLSVNKTPVQRQGNRLNKLLTNCDFSESTVVNVADFGDFTWPIRQKSPSHPNF